MLAAAAAALPAPPQEEADRKLAPSVSHHDLILHAADGRAVSVRVFAPARGCRRCALVIFSHGAFADYAHYGALVEEWARHGYVIAAPLHTDSEAYPGRKRFSMEDSRRTRLEDIAAVDAAFRPGARRLLSGISFSGRTFAAGHSYGALIAEVIGGARLDGDAETRLKRSWRVPSAVIAISPSGPNPGFVTDPGWGAMTRPTLIVTGTNDILKGFYDTYQVHLSSYRAAPAGVGYALVFDGMDHSFNGGFWKETPEGVGSASVARLNREVLAFLDDAAHQRRPTRAQWVARDGGGVEAETK